MYKGKNCIVKISKENCIKLASRFFAGISGQEKYGENHKHIIERSLNIRDKMESALKPRAVVSYFDEIVFSGKKVKINGESFFCDAFDQVNPLGVKGAYIYVLTSGDFLMEDSSTMEQIIADMWGTAFTDAARQQLKGILSLGGSLSNSFGPGFYGMDVGTMDRLMGMVNADAIGVGVRSSSILVPLKSCAGIFFDVTDDYIEINTECEECLGAVGSCDFCNMRKYRYMKNEFDEEAHLGMEPEKENLVKIARADEGTKTFACTGICAKCGRCRDAGMIAISDSRKTKLLRLPEDFVADTGVQGYGVAFDVGTTTVVGMLMDLYTGKHITSLAKTNPQNKYGLDVISRITYAAENEKNLEELHRDIIMCLNEIIYDMCDTMQVKRESIVRATIGGNTTMAHIIAGYSPESLAVAPFKPAYTGTLMKKGGDIGIKMHEEGDVMIFPNIAGHVGGDITAGLLATRFLYKKHGTLLIDIGTNGEIVLTNGKEVLACSTAAGPAFEGAAIYRGMRAAPGAIERIIIGDEKVLFRTIENREPVGICGSGLIDAIAQMLKAELIKKTGRLCSAEEYLKKKSDDKLAHRLRERNGVREFVLVFKEDGEDIVITQTDIREVQLAKGAISAGITIMLDTLHLEVEDIKEVIVAGAFGSFINKESALAIGLLPPVSMETIVSAGNTAGAGCLMAVINAEEAVKAKVIPQHVAHMELASVGNFQDKYVEAMSFIN